MARLLAKGWVVFCLFAGAHALALDLRGSVPPLQAATGAAICVFLFAAMGLLFVAGFGLSSAGGPHLLRTRLASRRFLPGFDGAVFLAFVAVSFAQIFVIPFIGGSAAGHGLQKAMDFVVPGLAGIDARLSACGITPLYIYSISLSSAVTWLLAMIFLASAVSRIRLSAGLLRLERVQHPTPFGPTVLAAIYGTVAIIAFQLLYMGSAYPLLPCKAFYRVTGAVLIGLAPLLLSYLIYASLVALVASGPEHHDRES
ncbi:MAG: hypothetical protein ISR49_04825 [Alphaproteobacteria bacterium]|nr:hypothetical protein [Alphaproteobacteria bacterium]